MVAATVVVEEEKEDEDTRKEREEARIQEMVAAQTEKERQRMQAEHRRMQRKEQEMERKEAEHEEKELEEKKKKKKQRRNMTYEKPGSVECERIASGLPIDGEEEMVARSFDIVMEVVLVDDDNDNIDPLWVQLEIHMKRLLVPDLIGCPRELFDERRLIRHSNPTSHHITSGSMSLMDVNHHRQLQCKSIIRYAIAKAMVTVRVTDDVCEKSSALNCSMVVVMLDLTVRDDEKILSLSELILDIFPEDRDIRPDLELVAPFVTVIIGTMHSLDPTPAPTIAPTGPASKKPSTGAPSSILSSSPTSSPQNGPINPAPAIDVTTPIPTKSPSNSPTAPPTVAPTSTPPTFAPQLGLSPAPTKKTSTRAPSSSPSNSPTAMPTIAPTPTPPTFAPQPGPSPAPTPPPTASPTIAPTKSPTKSPTDNPSSAPSASPSIQASAVPSLIPTSRPSIRPSNRPTSGPTSSPTFNPTASPTSASPRLGFIPLLRQGMTFEQSSTALSGGITPIPADAAFDGNYDSVSHTEFGTNQWWRARLQDFYGQPVNVKYVTVWNRRDCVPISICADRLIGATVRLYGAGTENLLVESAPLTSDLIQTVDFGEVDGVQYVQVHLARADFLHIAEIEAWGSIPNDSNNLGYAGLIKEGVSVEQSSTALLGGITPIPADLTVDGNYGTYSHTLFESSSWLRAKLQDFHGQPVTVNKVTVWNRPDCCLERLVGATVQLFGAGTNNLIAESAPLTSVLVQTVDFGEVTGVQYVQVHLARAEYLHIAEIEAWGKVP